MEKIRMKKTSGGMVIMDSGEDKNMERRKKKAREKRGGKHLQCICFPYNIRSMQLKHDEHIYGSI